MSFKFNIEKRINKNETDSQVSSRKNSRGRAGKIETPHGFIETPAFIVVGTKATVESLTTEQVSSIGAQAVLANTYHLYLEPGDEIVKKAGGLNKFMNWQGPTFTDSGGFQAFSLGVDFDNKVGKIAKRKDAEDFFLNPNAPVREGEEKNTSVSFYHNPLAKVDEDGVTFKSIIDGSTHRFTPERSIEIQHNIGADILFAFDECTSPHASYEYQREAMERTHRWAKRSLDYHKNKGRERIPSFSGHENFLLKILSSPRADALGSPSERSILSRLK